MLQQQIEGALCCFREDIVIHRERSQLFCLNKLNYVKIEPLFNIEDMLRLKSPVISEIKTNHDSVKDMIRQQHQMISQ